MIFYRIGLTAKSPVYDNITSHRAVDEAYAVDGDTMCVVYDSGQQLFEAALHQHGVTFTKKHEGD